MEEPVFSIVDPTAPRVPMLLSVPHCGTGFPAELSGAFDPVLAAAPDDTDWFLDRLYDFAPALGVTMIVPTYSRWVIDLNREPDSKPLYDDGRIITALCPATDFNGSPIYLDKRTEVESEEVERRLGSYFWPYHNKIDEICRDLAAQFGNVIFWDGHSIRRNVPTIQDEPFPDFILGDNDGKTADQLLIKTAFDALDETDYNVTHNTPFKGGYLTRSKGDPENRIHALQLEMSKDLYMISDETLFSEAAAEPIKNHLRGVFGKLISAVAKLA